MANKHRDKHQTPLWQGIWQHQKQENISLHTPGHKGRFVREDIFTEVFHRAIGFDLTELSGLDNLADPSGIIEQAQQLTAQVFGADRSFFLINGSTVGIQAMIMTACPPGSKLLVPRNVHRSVISGLILADVIPVFMDTGVDSRFGVPLPFNLRQVQEKLEEDKDIKAVLVINPTYHGLCGPLTKLEGLVHSYDLPLLVDEAHGTHFRFHSALPVSAMEAGADLCVQSMHKTGLSFTQSSLLHWRKGLINIDEVSANLQLLQSSSPSYLLMASLDWARGQMQAYAEHDLVTLLDSLSWFANELATISGIELLNTSWSGLSEVFAIDPCKINLSAIEVGWTGPQLASFLANCGIQLELIEPGFVLGITTVHTLRSDLEALIKALHKLEHNNHKISLGSAFLHRVHVPKLLMTPREAWFAPKKRLPVGQALGRAVAELIAPCPPGIALACPGEVVDEQVVAACLRWGVESLLVVR